EYHTDSMLSLLTVLNTSNTKKPAPTTKKSTKENTKSKLKKNNNNSQWLTDFFLSFWLSLLAFIRVHVHVHRFHSSFVLAIYFVLLVSGISEQHSSLSHSLPH